MVVREQDAMVRPALPRHDLGSALAPFRSDVGNGTLPPDFDSHNDCYDDNAYVEALAETDTCDNSSCPRGAAEPATYSITVERFDEGTGEFYDQTFRVCNACNRSCKKSFMGQHIKSRVLDNSVREALVNRTRTRRETETPAPAPAPIPAPAPVSIPAKKSPSKDVLQSPTPPVPLDVITALQDTLRVLNERPPTLAAFVATVLVRHNALCGHPVSTCPTCSHGLTCCSCSKLFTPAVARHLSCANCKHVASSCCATAFCCRCSKVWLPTDTVDPERLPARCFYGGAGSNSSPEPDIWTPSPRSSLDEIDDLTARAVLPLPVSRSESDVS